MDLHRSSCCHPIHSPNPGFATRLRQLLADLGVVLQHLGPVTRLPRLALEDHGTAGIAGVAGVAGIGKDVEVHGGLAEESPWILPLISRL